MWQLRAIISLCAVLAITCPASSQQDNPDISVDCGAGNVAINNAIAQLFYPTVSGSMEKLSIWMKPELYYTTQYRVRIYHSLVPGTNLIATSNDLTVESSQRGGAQSQFYDFQFPSTVNFNQGDGYVWKLERLSTYSGAFASCGDTIQGHGFWLADPQHPQINSDYSFKLYIAKRPGNPDISVDCGAGNVAINSGIAQLFYPSASGSIEKLSIWIKPASGYETVYRVTVYHSFQPGTNLIATSKSLIVCKGSGSTPAPAKFYDITFPSSVSLTQGEGYVWKLERLSKFSGGFARCPNTIEGYGFWLAKHPESRYDYSFKLNINRTSLRGSLQFLMRHSNSKVINHQGWNE